MYIMILVWQPQSLIISSQETHKRGIEWYISDIASFVNEKKPLKLLTVCIIHISPVVCYSQYTRSRIIGYNVYNTFKLCSFSREFLSKIGFTKQLCGNICSSISPPHLLFIWPSDTTFSQFMSSFACMDKFHWIIFSINWGGVNGKNYFVQQTTAICQTFSHCLW